MTHILRTLLLVSVVFATSQQADAAMRFRALLSHDQEVADPPVPFQGSSGIGWFVLSDDMTSLSYDIQLIGLDLDGLQTLEPEDDVTRTHFHAAPAGANGGVVFGLIDPLPALENDLDDLVVDPIEGRIMGVWDAGEGNGTTLADQLANLLDGALYVNVHTFDHPAGEIRGQIVYVPEPAAWSGLALAAGGWWCLRRRKVSDRTYSERRKSFTT